MNTVRTLSLVAVLTLGPLGLSACGGTDATTNGTTDAATDAADPDTALAEVQAETGVPEECREAFPVAVGKADVAAVSLMPASWPQDAVDGTLCQTSASGSGVQVASYATSASGTEVLDAVQDALPASYEVVRSDQGMGEQLDGSGEGVSFRVTTREGAFEVMLSQE